MFRHVARTLGLMNKQGVAVADQPDEEALQVVLYYRVALF